MVNELLHQLIICEYKLFFYYLAELHITLYTFCLNEHDQQIWLNSNNMINELFPRRYPNANKFNKYSMKANSISLDFIAYLNQT